MIRATEKRGYRCLDGSERRSKLVRDRIEQHGAELLAFAGGLGATEFFDGAGALNGDGHQTADRFERMSRYLCSSGAHTADDPDAHAQGHESHPINHIDSRFPAHTRSLQIA